MIKFLLLAQLCSAKLINPDSIIHPLIELVKIARAHHTDFDLFFPPSEHELNIPEFPVAEVECKKNVSKKLKTFAAILVQIKDDDDKVKLLENRWFRWAEGELPLRMVHLQEMSRIIDGAHEYKRQRLQLLIHDVEILKCNRLMRGEGGNINNDCDRLVDIYIPYASKMLQRHNELFKEHVLASKWFEVVNWRALLAKGGENLEFEVMKAQAALFCRRKLWVQLVFTEAIEFTAGKPADPLIPDKDSDLITEDVDLKEQGLDFIPGLLEKLKDHSAYVDEVANVANQLVMMGHELRAAEYAYIQIGADQDLQDAVTNIAMYLTAQSQKYFVRKDHLVNFKDDLCEALLEDVYGKIVRYAVRLLVKIFATEKASNERDRATSLMVRIIAFLRHIPWIERLQWLPSFADLLSADDWNLDEKIKANIEEATEKACRPEGLFRSEWPLKIHLTGLK